jgi:hypothetical protein
VGKNSSRLIVPLLSSAGVLGSLLYVNPGLASVVKCIIKVLQMCYCSKDYSSKTPFFGHLLVYMTGFGYKDYSISAIKCTP